MPRIVFLHDNYPAQFGAFGHYLSSKGWDVLYGTQRKVAQPQGVTIFNYAPHRGLTKEIHPYAATYERAVLNGQAVARAALKLKAGGYRPDIVMAHSGWGAGLFVKDVWPDAHYIGYFEWYYRADAEDISFLDDGARAFDDELRSRSRNAPILMDLAHCDSAIVPTEYQKSQFPSSFLDKLTVFHDGVDTNYFAPAPDARLHIPSLDLSHVDELVTYVARGMEPYRGFPAFMRALEIVLKARPNAHAVIVGEDRIAYGRRLPEGESWKKRMLAECDLDPERVHFTGLFPRDQYRAVLQASAVHRYLTAPFVLSWSLLEAMSAGCALVVWDTAPVKELIARGADAFEIAPPKSHDAVAEAAIRLLDEKALRISRSEKARQIVLSDYQAATLWPEKAALLMRRCRTGPQTTHMGN